MLFNVEIIVSSLFLNSCGKANWLKFYFYSFISIVFHVKRINIISKVWNCSRGKASSDYMNDVITDMFMTSTELKRWYLGIDLMTSINNLCFYSYRYYRINPVGRIQAAANKRNLSELPDLSATNCPPYSTSCLVSHVTFQCNNNQDTNGVCHLNDQITADSYGYQRNWTPKAVYPPETSSGDLKGSTAFITMQGGPCYYCDNSKRKLSTVIGFYCDERITVSQNVRQF